MPLNLFTNIQVRAQQNESVPSTSSSNLLTQTVQAQKELNYKVKVIKKVARGMIKLQEMDKENYEPLRPRKAKKNLLRRQNQNSANDENCFQGSQTQANLAEQKSMFSQWTSPALGIPVEN